MVVGFHPAPFTHFHPGFFQTNAVGVGRAPHCHQLGVHDHFNRFFFFGGGRFVEWGRADNDPQALLGLAKN